MNLDLHAELVDLQTTVNGPLGSGVRSAGVWSSSFPCSPFSGPKAPVGEPGVDAW